MRANPSLEVHQLAVTMPDRIRLEDLFQVMGPPC